MHVGKDRLVSWRYVQPLRIEDASAGDKVTLSVTRNQIGELPPRRPGRRPGRAFRQGAAGGFLGPGHREGGRDIAGGRAAGTAADSWPTCTRSGPRPSFRKCPCAQLADLFSVLPLDDRSEMLALLPKDLAERTAALLSAHE